MFTDRTHPAHGVSFEQSDFPIVFLTICTDVRKRWLASDAVHDLLRKTWRHADAWFVGRYMIMPDHIHLFATPGRIAVPFDNWVRFRKSRFTKAHRDPDHRWQTDHWDTRLRNWQSYSEKWDYVRYNPVRHGLVEDPKDWPFQGELNEVRWD